MIFIFISLLFKGLFTKTYLIFIDSVTNTRTNSFSKISIEFRERIHEDVKTSIMLYNLETGTRNPFYEQIKSEINGGYITINDIKSIKAFIEIRDMPIQEVIHEDFSINGKIKISLRSLKFEFSYFIVGDVKSEIDEEYLKVTLKGFLWIYLPSALQSYEFSISSQNQIRYKLSTRKSYLLIIPIYSKNDIKLKHNSEIISPNLSHRSFFLRSNTLSYSWHPYVQEINSVNTHFKIYYFITVNNGNNVFLTKASFCLYESKNDKFCRNGFINHKFSSSVMYKVPIDFRTLTRNNQNYYLQIVIRTFDKTTLNPFTLVIDAVLNEKIITSGLSFQLCKNIHCFIFLRESQIKPNTKLHIYAQAYKHTGICIPSHRDCLKSLDDLIENPRRHSIVSYSFENINDFLILFAIENNRLYPIVLRPSYTEKIINDRYKINHGLQKIVFLLVH